MSEFIRDESTGNRDYAYPDSATAENIRRSERCTAQWRERTLAMSEIVGSLGQLREAMAALTERVGELEERVEAVATFSATTAVQIAAEQDRLGERIEQLERPSMTGSVQGLDAVFSVTPWPRFLELMEESSVD